MKKPALAIVLLLACLASSAQDKEKNVLSVVSSDSLNVFLKSYLEQTTGQRFEDPTIPRFLISDRKDMFVFGVGGYVGAKLIYDYGGNSASGLQPLDAAVTAHDNDVLGIDMTSSRFFFKVLGNTKKGIAEAYIEAGFNGTNNTLKLLKAYVNVLGFRVGLSNTAFADNQTIPIITGGGVYSFNDRAVPMIAYSYLFKSGVRLQAGLEFPQATTIMTAEENGDPRKVVTVEMPHPDLTLSTYYNHNNLHLFAGGYLRLMKYYDYLDSQKFVVKPGGAVNLSGNYTFRHSSDFNSRLFLQAQYEYMMADCFDNLNGKGLSAIMPMRLGYISYDYTQGVGGQVGYQINFGLNSFNLQAGANRLFGHEKSGFDDLYKLGYVTTLNYMRKFWKYGTIGAEVAYCRNYTLAGSVLSDVRGVIHLRYDF